MCLELTREGEREKEVREPHLLSEILASAALSSRERVTDTFFQQSSTHPEVARSSSVCLASQQQHHHRRRNTHARSTTTPIATYQNTIQFIHSFETLAYCYKNPALHLRFNPIAFVHVALVFLYDNNHIRYASLLLTPPCLTF